ncbi:GNAT family N-acetyltransferase [Mucilaginibacter koreensis]
MHLYGNGFTLRPWTINDAPAMQRHADNANVYDFLLDRFPKPYTLNDAIAFINSRTNIAGLHLAIEVNGEAIGALGVELRSDVYRKTPLLGYWLSEAHWGKGIMPEAVKLITQHAFDTLNIICIQACVLSKNPKSMRVLEKAGYEKQGILRQSVIKNEEVFDEHVYAAYKIR